MSLSALQPLKATVNCDMGEGFSLYKMGDDESLMKTIHLANIACGFHASDFAVMNKTVDLAKDNSVLVGAHPSLPDLQGFGRREMAIEPDELKSCFLYQVGALTGFLRMNGMRLNHIKPHGAIYGQTARSIDLANAVVSVCKVFGDGWLGTTVSPSGNGVSSDGSGKHSSGVAFMGLAGTAHQTAAKAQDVPFIAEWFADLDYNDQGQLQITKVHKPVTIKEVQDKTRTLLTKHQITTTSGNLLPIGEGVTEVSICCHSDTPGAVEIAQAVKAVVDEINQAAGYTQ